MRPKKEGSEKTLRSADAQGFFGHKIKLSFLIYVGKSITRARDERLLASCSPPAARGAGRVFLILCIDDF